MSQDRTDTIIAEAAQWCYEHLQEVESKFVVQINQQAQNDPQLSEEVRSVFQIGEQYDSWWVWLRIGLAMHDLAVEDDRIGIPSDPADMLADLEKILKNRRKS
jgi:hypothetical protein